MENINLIRKIAWSFHESTGLDWDDLFQEGALAYLEAMKTYDEKKGKITTYVWHCIVSRLKNYLKSEREYNHPLCSIEEARQELYYTSWFWEKIPEELHEQVSIILDNAHILDSCFLEDCESRWVQFSNEGERKKEARLIIRNLLRRTGYDRQEVQGTIQKLVVTVSNF